MTRILIIQGHPDGSRPHYCHALAESYREGALDAGYPVDVLDLGRTDIPLLRSKAEWEDGAVPDFVREAQDAIEASDHLVFIYPLWMGTMPAVLKAWLEHVFRPRFAFNLTDDGLGWMARLGGQSARIVVTMGMPALLYRWFYGAHSLHNFERNILKFSGVKPVRTSVIGLVDARDPAKRRHWLERMAQLGSRAA